MGLEIIGAGLNYKASKKAAKAQEEGAAQANATAKDISEQQLDLQRQIWEQQQKDQAPWLKEGQTGITKLGALMGNGDPFKDYLAKAGLAGGQFNQSNPQYQFLLKQGQNQLDRNNASSGMGYSGSQLKAAQQFGQGLASQQYDNEYNRVAKEYFNKYDQAANQFGNYYNRLAALAQGGQQAVQATGNQGAQYGQNVGGTLGSLSTQLQNNIGQLGNARASGYIGQANAITGGLQNITDNMFRAAGLLYPKGINNA
jgi:hypothetical protein